MGAEEQTMLNFHYSKSLFQVAIEADLKLSLLQGRALKQQFETPGDMMPEHFRHALLEYYDVGRAPAANRRWRCR